MGAGGRDGGSESVTTRTALLADEQLSESRSAGHRAGAERWDWYRENFLSIPSHPCRSECGQNSRPGSSDRQANAARVVFWRCRTGIWIHAKQASASGENPLPECQENLTCPHRVGDAVRGPLRLSTVMQRTPTEAPNEPGIYTPDFVRLRPHQVDCCGHPNPEPSKDWTVRFAGSAAEHGASIAPSDEAAARPECSVGDTAWPGTVQ